MRKGFSLIEVLVFITILGVFFVAASTVVTYLLSTMKSSEYRIIASHYAEEAVEWIRSEKEDDWSEFIQKASGSGALYCINSLNWSTDSSCGETTFGTPNIFKREATLTSSGSPTSQVEVNVTISWDGVNKTDTVVLKTILKVWE